VLRILLPVLLIAFTVFCLVDVSKTGADEVRALPKAVWLIVVLLLPGVGGVAWLLAGRQRGTGPLGRGGPRPAGPLGPDDDPDFLRGI
jgi:Phospholipase_D-nuclease N-terminal